MVSNQTRRNVLSQLHFVHFLYLLLFSGVESTLTFLAVDRFKYSNMDNGRLLTFIGVLSALIQGGFLRRRGAQIGEHLVALGGIFALLLSTFALAEAWRPPLLYFGASLFTCASAVVVSCLTSLTSMYATADRKGTELGQLRSFGQLGRAFGPLIISLLCWAQGSELAYLLTGVAVLVPLLFMIKLAKEIALDKPKKIKGQ